MPLPATIAIIALVLIAIGLLARREIRLVDAELARKAARAAQLKPYFAALRQEAILHTTSFTLDYDIQGVSRTTSLVMAESDARPLRFVAPYGCDAVCRNEPTGWGDWCWTELYFRPKDCGACGGPCVTLYRFRAYRFDNGDGLGPVPIASLCLDCRVPRGEDGMSEEDIAFIHRCREIARRLARGDEGGPYRSAA